MRRNICRAVLLVVGAVTIASAPSLAQAQEQTFTPEQSTEQAKKLFEQARGLIESKQYAAAINILDSVLQLEPRSIGAHFNLGDCYEKTGKPVKAWFHFNEARKQAEARKDDRAAASKQRAEALEAKMPKISVASPADGQEIRVNGEVIPQGRWNKALLQGSGRKDIIVSAPGYNSWTSQVNVTDDGQPGDIQVPALELDTSKGRGQRTIGLIVGGVGIAGLAVGAITGLMASGKKTDEENALAACNAPSPAPGLVVGGKCLALEDAKDSGKSLATVSTIGFIAGGVLVVGGAVLYFTAPKGGAGKEAGPPPPAAGKAKPFQLSDVALAPATGPTNVGLSLSGRW